MHYNLQEFCDGSYRQSPHHRYNKDMRIRILTIFPDQFESFLRHPLTARAIERGLLDLGIIDLKEYAKKQIEKKNNELKDLKAREQRAQKALSDIQMDIAILEDYDPNELTSKKINEILKNVTETH